MSSTATLSSTARIHRSAADDAVKPLTSKPMTPEEVNHARRQHNLPLDSGAETEQPVQPKQEPMNFRITDDDLGAGGPKTKYKANVEAIRVLQTLDAEQRQATAEEQEVLSRYVGWGGIPQAFDEKNADWAKEYPPLMEKPMNQKPSLHQMEHYQKFYENGEYVRAVESTTEQNYNMIDGCANNLPKPRIINGRESVLDKLRIRQMAREKQKSSQEQSADMERNRK